MLDGYLIHVLNETGARNYGVNYDYFHYNMNEEDKPLNSINEEEELRSPTPYWVTTEREGSKYNLSRAEIEELGFLRSDPTRFIYVHKENNLLTLAELFEYNFGVKDFVEERIVINIFNGSISEEIYNSTAPNKYEIEAKIKQYII